MMRYQIQAPPSVTVARQQEELARLRRYAGQLQLHWLRVGPPHRPQVELLQLLEVPERWAEQSQQLLTSLTGREDAATRTVYQVRRRPEWGTSLLLYPTAEAQALDGAVLDGAASAWLTVRSGWWGTLATLRVGAADVDAVLAAAGARGWAASPRGGQALLSQLRGAGRNTPLALGTGGTPAQGGPEPSSSPTAVELPAVAAGSSSLLADADTPGWLLGVRDDGRAVELTWGNHIVALDGPREAVQGALRALVRRALGLPRDAAPGLPPDTSLGVVALIDRQLLDWPDLERFAARLWRLDARDRWSSVMVPWRSLPPAALAEVLRWHGLTAPLPGPLPARLDELLAVLGGGHLATEALRDLTAHPGDDVRAAIAAGGGLVQLRDGAPEEELLTDLLLAVLAEPPALGRPLLLIRPAGLAIPPALALQAIQVVIGPEAGAAATLRSSPGGRGGWHLTWADGSAPLALQADLDAEPLSTRDQIHARIIAGLGEAGAVPAMGSALPAGAPDEEPWEALAGAALEGTVEGEPVPHIPADLAPATAEFGTSGAETWEALAEAALGRTVEGEPVPETPADLAPATGETSTLGEESWEAVLAAAFGAGAAEEVAPEISVDQAGAARDELDDEGMPADVLDEAAWDALADAALGAHTELATGEAVGQLGASELDQGDDAPVETEAQSAQRRAGLIRRRPRHRFGATRMPAHPEEGVSETAPLDERSPADERPASPIGDQFGDTPFWLVEPSRPPAVEEPQHVTAETVEQPSHSTVTAPDQQVYRLSLHDPASWRAAWQAGVAQAELLRCLQELDPTTDRAALRQQLREHLLAPVAAGAAPARAAPLHATEPRPATPPVVALPPSHGTAAGTVAQPAETGAPNPAAAPAALASDTLDGPEARALWAAWQAGEPLDQLLIARCGYARGKAAEHTKDGIYRAVVPQILRTLRAEALVPALLAGVELVGDQVEQYEQVLRQLARIDRPVTGVLRTQMHARLLQVLQQQLQEV